MSLQPQPRAHFSILQMSWGQFDGPWETSANGALLCSCCSCYPCPCSPARVLICQIKHPMLVAINGSVFTCTQAPYPWSPFLSEIVEQVENQLYRVITHLPPTPLWLLVMVVFSVTLAMCTLLFWLFIV